MMSELLNAGWARTIVTIASMIAMGGVAYGLVLSEVSSNTERSKANTKAVAKMYDIKSDVRLNTQILRTLIEDVKEIKDELSKSKR